MSRTDDDATLARLTDLEAQLAQLIRSREALAGRFDAAAITLEQAIAEDRPGVVEFAALEQLDASVTEADGAVSVLLAALADAIGALGRAG